MKNNVNIEFFKNKVNKNIFYLAKNFFKKLKPPKNTLLIKPIEFEKFQKLNSGLLIDIGSSPKILGEVVYSHSNNYNKGDYVIYNKGYSLFIYYINMSSKDDYLIGVPENMIVLKESK